MAETPILAWLSDKKATANLNTNNTLYEYETNQQEHK